MFHHVVSSMNTSRPSIWRHPVAARASPMSSFIHRGWPALFTASQPARQRVHGVCPIFKAANGMLNTTITQSLVPTWTPMGIRKLAHTTHLPIPHGPNVSMKMKKRELKEELRRLRAEWRLKQSQSAVDRETHSLVAKQAENHTQSDTKGESGQSTEVQAPSGTPTEKLVSKKEVLLNEVRWLREQLLQIEANKGSEVNDTEGSSQEVADRREESSPDLDSPVFEHPSLHGLQFAYLPFKAQHYVLTEAQRIAEESCFNFAQTWLPSFLQQYGWDCACAGEMNAWANFFIAHAEEVPRAVFQPTELPLPVILNKTILLRNIAVHRVPTPAPEVVDLIAAAHMLTITLGDKERMAQLGDLRALLDWSIETMTMNKTALKSSVGPQLYEIQQQRDELARREREIIARLWEEDAAQRAHVGSMMEQSIMKALRKNVSPEELYYWTKFSEDW
ncbi:uncharacterized protein BCR38DRAFT_490962 [Pseudomassariella vexata]|uniref:Uncharacterized protein n=1 Tax=Pseudomassariella vexata TaxID=1141098 RepID=A0A1Y2D8M8_9PEZI|nr:uncharacterized protein BCR38DRAFT_490962 [Pseudomassariella vexata]ORY55619.1 hypothetical protein BCR38DRAFT_490962 [Pseudomassariella vexata]